MHDNWTNFLNTRIDLSKGPMHPRPETEWWVEKFTETLGARDSNGAPSSILDVFTGSGCIGIAVANKFPTVQVTLSDKTNYVSTPLPANAKFVQSDLFANITGKFDFILANPPYVPVGKGSGGIMESEPSEALYAGADGLGVIRPFLELARSYIKDKGEIWLEFGSDQKEAITNMLRELNYYSGFSCTFHRDQYNEWRYLVIHR